MDDGSLFKVQHQPFACSESQEPQYRDLRAPAPSSGLDTFKDVCQALPKYLLSYAFWDAFLVNGSSSLGKERKKIFEAAKGILRTYYYLIQHESDFDMAQKAD
jgi:hypothetical protein